MSSNKLVTQFAAASPTRLSTDIFPLVQTSDLSTGTATYTPLSTLSAYFAIPVLAGNTVIVDAVNGNDSTGTVGTLQKSFLTLAAAQAAAIAATGSWTIVVYPGTYTTSTSLGASGINWHFMNGATVNVTSANTFVDTGGISYKVSGSGIFTTTTGSIIAFTNGGSIVFEAESVTGASSIGIFYGTGASVITANIKQYLVSTGGYISILSNTAYLYLSVPTITASGGSNGFVFDNSTTFAYINTNIYTSSGAYALENGGNIVFNGDIVYSGSTAALGDTGSVASNWSIHGNITVIGTAPAINMTVSTGTIDIYGVVTGRISILVSKTVTFHSNVVSNVASTSTITQAAGTVIVLGKIINQDTNAASYGIIKTGGVTIVDNATIVTSGATASIYAATSQPVLVYGTLTSTVAVGVNITNPATGVFQVYSGVI